MEINKVRKEINMEKNDIKSEKPLDFEIDFYERLLEKKPDYVDALIPLAEDYTKRGDFEKGLEIDLRLSVLRPEDAVVLYNLACSYSLSKQIDASLEMLEKSIKLGYSDLEYIDTDPDLKNLREDIRYEKLRVMWKGN